MPIALRISSTKPACTRLMTLLLHSRLFKRPWRCGMGIRMATWDGGPALRLEAIRLEELRPVAVEDWIEAELTLGQHERVIGQLQSLVREHSCHCQDHRQDHRLRPTRVIVGRR